MKVYFNSGNKADPYNMSVNSKKMSKSHPTQIHTLGFEQAKNLNKQKMKRGYEPNERYVGFLQSEASQLNGIRYDDHFVIVEHAPLQGNKLHCNVVLKFPENLTKPKSTKRDRIVSKVNECFGSSVEEA